MLERAVSQTVVLKSALVFLSHSECLNASFILEFQTRLGCTVLDLTKDLDIELGVLDEAAIATHLFILDV